MLGRLLQASSVGLLEPAMLREAAWLVAGFSSKLGLQLGTLYYLTSNLGVERVGVFFALVGLFACLVPFVQLGNYDLTVRQIARREDPRCVAGRALRSSAAGFLILAPILLLLKLPFAGQIGWLPYLAAAFGELFVMRVLSNIQAVATGFRLHYVVATSDFLLGSSRLIAVYAAARLQGGLDTVVLLYAITTWPAALAGCLWLLRRTGVPIFDAGPIFTEVRDHLRMVMAWFAEMAAREGDKLLLNLLAGPRDTGIYGTATRLFSVFLVPIDILTQVFRPRVSQAYVDGAEGGRRMWFIMAIVLGGCGILMGAALLAVSALLPRMMSSLKISEFGEVQGALVLLALIPPLYGMQRANVVSAIARGAIGAYSNAVAAGALCAAATIVILAPSHGWRGACIAAEVYFGVSCLASFLFARDSKPGSTAQATTRASWPVDAQIEPADA